MKVSDLIELLQTMPADALVLSPNGELPNFLSLEMADVRAGFARPSEYLADGFDEAVASWPGAKPAVFCG